MSALSCGHNVEIAGCPSYLINPSQHLWRKLLVKSRKQNLRIIGLTEGSYNRKGDAGAKRLERLLLDMVFYCGCYYIGQTDMGVMQHALPVKPVNLEEIQYKMRKSMAPKLSQEEFCSIANSRFLAFWRMDSWLAALSRMDFVTGTRIHGNVLALQSEVPAIPIVHDSRTLGLCQTLKIPFTSMEQAQEWSSPSQVISQLDTWRAIESEKLDRHRCQLANKYLTHLLSLNLKPSNHLVHLASGFSSLGSHGQDSEERNLLQEV
ncbi:MAG TPA: polysaccharide pyruvyl transferase family protein [Oscillatoriales cyanobacterium M4454_W2019_049]|nr:polysaccharide pyruvyl transferase family protein [Oscillatoriales cyanobacterium M4454_W2019_049]